MAIYTLPDSLKIEKMAFGVNTYALPFSNADTGASSTRLLGPPRWTLSFSSASDLSLTDAGPWVSLLMRVGGRIHHLEAWDKSRPAPSGTLRGTLVLASTVKEGDTEAIISAGAGQAGRTLLDADWLQFGSGLGTSQLVAVMGPATADAAGTITIQFESPARLTFPAGTPVTWDKARTYFKSNSNAVTWSAERNVQGGFSFDGTEQWNA